MPMASSHSSTLEAVFGNALLWPYMAAAAPHGDQGSDADELVKAVCEFARRKLGIIACNSIGLEIIAALRHLWWGRGARGRRGGSLCMQVKPSTARGRRARRELERRRRLGRTDRRPLTIAVGALTLSSGL